MTKLLARGVKAFGKFWWDFLVGDTPELALATGIIVALAFLLDGDRLVGVILLPLLAAAFLLASTLRGRRRARGASPPSATQGGRGGARRLERYRADADE